MFPCNYQLSHFLYPFFLYTLFLTLVIKLLPFSYKKKSMSIGIQKLITNALVFWMTPLVSSLEKKYVIIGSGVNWLQISAKIIFRISEDIKRKWNNKNLCKLNTTCLIVFKDNSQLFKMIFYLRLPPKTSEGW